MVEVSIAVLYTVEPVYNVHCISRAPLYNSQVTESQMGLQCAFQPALTGHICMHITTSFLGPKGDHYRQVPLYMCIHSLNYFCLIVAHS